MKYVLIFLAALAFFGCEEQAQNWNDKGRIYKMMDVDSSNDFSIYCDRSTNIAYLRYWQSETWQSETKNGFTVYYNRDGQPARCNEVRK